MSICYASYSGDYMVHILLPHERLLCLIVIGIVIVVVFIN